MLLVLLGCPRDARPLGSIPLLTIEQILLLPDEEIDIGMAALSLAKEFHPNLDHDFFLFAFDYLTMRYSQYFGHLTDPDLKIRALNTFLYRPGPWNDSITFDYDYSDPKAQKRTNKFINGYIATRKGSCITMPMLYVVLGERLGMPIYAVRAPNHFFVRYYPEEPILNFETNVEATSGGGYSSDEEYALDMAIPGKGIKTGMYLRTLRKKEYIASLLLINAHEYMERKQFDKAQRYAKLALAHDSTLATAVWAYGLVHYMRAMDLQERMQSEIHLEMTVHQAVARVTSVQQASRPWTAANVSKDPSTDGAREYGRYSEILLPPLIGSAVQQQYRSLQTGEQATTIHRPMSAEQLSEIQQIREKFLPLMNKDLEVWYTCKEKAKDMGMAVGPQTSFLMRQTNKLKQFKENEEK